MIKPSAILFCTRSRNRTGTAITGHWILSPARLPIPPFGQRGANLVKYFLKKSEFIKTDYSVSAFIKSSTAPGELIIFVNVPIVSSGQCEAKRNRP